MIFSASCITDLLERHADKIPSLTPDDWVAHKDTNRLAKLTEASMGVAVPFSASCYKIRSLSKAVLQMLDDVVLKMSLCSCPGDAGDRPCGTN